MRVFVGAQIGLDVGEPAIELLRRPRVDVRESADNTGPAQSRHQGRKGDKKHRRADRRHRQRMFQRTRQGHRRPRAPMLLQSHQFLHAPMALKISGTASAASRTARVERAAAAIKFSVSRRRSAGPQRSPDAHPKSRYAGAPRRSRDRAVRRRRKAVLVSQPSTASRPERVIGACSRRLAVAAMDDELWRASDQMQP